MQIASITDRALEVLVYSNFQLYVKLAGAGFLISIVINNSENIALANACHSWTLPYFLFFPECKSFGCN